MIELLLELTDSCNLHCKYCNKWQGSQFLTGEIIDARLKKIQEIFGSDIRYICFWGGEPFLNPFLDDIFLVIENSFLKDKKIDIGFNTNGIFLEKKIDRLMKFCHNMKDNNIVLYVSLDGITSVENKNRDLTEDQIKKIISTVMFLKNQNIANLKIVISSVLVADVVSLEQFASSLNFFRKQDIDVNYCFQEYMQNTILNMDSSILRSLLERYFFLKNQNIPVVYEDNNRFGELFRINTGGDIFNLIDGCFGNNNFLLGNIKQMHTLPMMDKPNNYDIWKTVYKLDSYITLISKLHNSNTR